MAGPRVTDHALVRWLERSGAMDTEAMRELLSASLANAMAAAEQLEARRFLVLADGLVYVIEGAVLVTVIEDDGRHAHMWHHSDAKRARFGE